MWLGAWEGAVAGAGPLSHKSSRLSSVLDNGAVLLGWGETLGEVLTKPDSCTGVCLGLSKAGGKKNLI